MAQPGVADVRVSCPACGGPIHPIAGRCKHCRTDLVAVRGGATGAQGTMIQLGQMTKLPASSTAPIGSAAPAPLAGGLPMPLAGGLPMPLAVPAVPAFKPAAPRGQWGKRWPLWVAAIAAVAIIASVAVLFLSDGGKQTRKRRSLGPAPDRMQTDDLPTDPWARGSGGSGGSGAGSADSQRGPITPPAVVPDIAPSDDEPTPLEDDSDDEPDGVFGGVAGGVSGGSVDLAKPEQFFLQAVEVTCKRLSACWGDTNATALCDQARNMVQQQSSAAAMLCPSIDRTAATQCLDQLAALPCPDQSASMDEVATMAYALDPCTRACER